MIEQNRREEEKARQHISSANYSSHLWQRKIGHFKYLLRYYFILFYFIIWDIVIYFKTNWDIKSDLSLREFYMAIEMQFYVEKWGCSASVYKFLDYVSKILRTSFWHKQAVWENIWVPRLDTRGAYPILHIKLDNKQNTPSI